MANQGLKLIEIEKLLSNFYFFIPSYQRGYKWDTQQVVDLLNDIYEFANKQKLKDEFYCLQPIVVLEEKSDNEKEKRYRVIDGQQRLTTIYLILKYLQNLKKEFEEIKKKCGKIEYFCNFENYEIKEPYYIKYETRKNSENFLKEIHKNYNNENEKYKNPDYFYLSNAYELIMKWFKNKNKQLFLDTLLHKTKIIWYEVKVENEEKEIEIFSRLNMGKIPLTNAELIKAMLLLEVEDYKEQIEFSNIWDKMELTLQNEEFWYFLSDKKKAITAIDLVFEVLAEQYKEEYYKNNEITFNPSDDKFSFYVFDKLIKENKKSRSEIWEDTQKIYRFFVDWYNDREIYHKVGYIIKFKILNLNLTKNLTKLILTKLIIEYKQKTKDNFKKFLNEIIKSKLKEIRLNKLNYGDKNVHRVLLLFNIETILQNPNSNHRFKFDKYKKESWDIEHIAPQTDNTNKEEWVRTVYKYLKGKELKFKKKIIENKYDYIYKIIKSNIKELDEKLKNNIGNLVLLNSKVNRSYGNAFFLVKRAIIIEEDSKGNFIPPATKNVFLKQYSNKLSDMMNWNEDDIKSYRKKIYELTKKYGVKLGDEDE